MGSIGWERVRPVDVGAVVELARAGEFDVQLDALEALAALRFDADGWRHVSSTVVDLLRKATPASEERRRLIDVAAAIPLVTVQREIQRIADSRTDPDRVAALPGLARYGLVKPVHVRRLLRDGVQREVLAALPLEDAGLDPAGVEVASLSNGNEPDDDARLWGAIAAGRAGSLAALDRELERLATGESQPSLFHGSPWTAYDRLAAVRPLPATMDAHLLTRPPSLVVWALTGSADAEGTPISDETAPGEAAAPDVIAPPPSPVEAGATVMRALRAAGTRPDFVAGNEVVRLALSFPALELPTKELHERCGDCAASPRQLAWLAGRSGLRRAAIAIDEEVAAAVSPERAGEALAFLRDVALSYTANPFEGSGGGDASIPPRLELVDDSPPPPIPPPSIAPGGGVGGSPEFGVRGGGPGLGGGAPTPPGAPVEPADPTTPADERHYKASFTDEVDGWRDLHVQVATAQDGNVLQGLTRVGDEEVPAAGMVTSWLVRSGRRPLRSTDPAVRVESAPVNGVEEWFARFELLVPRSGPSEERTLGVSTDGGPIHLDVTVMVDMRPYRDFTITIGGPAGEERTDRRFLDEHAAAAAPPAEEPADRALILVHGPGESHLLAEVGADRYDTRAGWPSEAQLSGLVRNVRGAADRWRGEASSLLDALDPADVDAALDLPLPVSWRDDPGALSAEHDERWRAAAGSTVLRELASHGRALYDVLFPVDTPTRTVLDTMEPGSSLSISWTADTDGFAGAIPWTLLYTGPYDRSAPVDPAAFLGLKLRVKYTFFEPPDPSTSLAADHGFTNVLYWGESEGDVTGQQSVWQRSWMTGLRPSARLLPSSAAARRDEVVEALTAARDASVVYLFCQCGVTSEGGSAVLTFDDADAASQIADWELRGAPLPNHPLVFANACDTGRASVYEINAVLALFMARQCRAYIGTEAKIPIVLGSRVARIFFHYFTVEGLTAGEALACTRRLLWLRFRNPGGLLYSYINQYDLRLAAVGEG